MERFTSRFNRVLAVCVWAVEALAVGAYVWLHAGFPQPLWLLPTAFVAFAAWAWLWRPAVEVDDEGVRLVNLVRTVRVPWSALIQVDTRFALTLVTPKHRYAAWAAPAPGRTGLAMARRREARASTTRVPDLGASVRPGDLLGTESGEAAAMVRQRWHELREGGRVEIGIAEESRVDVRVHWWEDATLLALLVGTVLAVALG